MKARALKYYILIIIPSLLFCSKNDEANNVSDIDKNCYINIDTIDFTFGIDYTDLDKYLIPGEESDLDDIYLEQVRRAVGTPFESLDDILRVCHWVNQNFKFENAGGTMAGKNTINELYEIKTFYGCHSLALIISSIIRELGFPAIMIETFDVNWAYNYNAGTVNYFSGHVMSEIYIDDRWILLDNNCYYVEEYNHSDPFISTSGTPAKGYFVFAKGTDIWDYNEKDSTFTDKNLLFYSDNVYCFEDMFNTVSYQWKN